MSRISAFALLVTLAASLAQVLLQKRGLKLNPITSLYYISPCCFVFLAFPWAFLELPKLLNSPEPVRACVAWSPYNSCQIRDPAS